MLNIVDYLNSGQSNHGTPKEASREMGKDVFMELLMAQIINQNPMQPMENTEFIAQMAQFSSLEQMQNVAAGMEMLALSQTASTNSQMVNMIGKRVIVPGNQFSFDGENPIKVRFDLDKDEKPTELIVRDANGEIIKNIQIKNYQPGANYIEIDGKLENDQLMAAGHYTYELRNDAQEILGKSKLYANYLVDAVAFDGTAIILKSLGQEIDLADICEVYQK
jgi:flagellar basal-body rod modification protein FlgD